MKPKYLIFLVIAFTVSLEGWTKNVFSQTLPTYTAAVMAKSYDEKREKGLEKFEEIIGKYMEEKIGIKIRLTPLTYPDLIKAVDKATVDFIWGYGLVVSMELGQKLPIIPVVAPTLGEEKRTSYKRMVISVKGGVQRLEDLKGKRLTHVGDETWSFELLLLKVWLAEKMGVRDIHQFFSLRGRQPDEGFFVPGSKRGAIYSLFVKEADLAVAHEFEYLTQEKLTPNAIREKTEILPFFNPSEGFMEAPIFIRRGLPRKDVDKLVKSLIEMPNDPEGKQILISTKISGFVRVTDQDYQSVRTLITKKEGLGIK
jgi:ABC-type phosphate/phosphonate transport system substrate-binding protein